MWVVFFMSLCISLYICIFEISAVEYYPGVLKEQSSLHEEPIKGDYSGFSNITEIVGLKWHENFAVWYSD